MPPLRQTSGHSFLRRPGPTKDCPANDDDFVIGQKISPRNRFVIQLLLIVLNRWLHNRGDEQFTWSCTSVWALDRV